MKNGELYKTPGDQERLVIGKVPNGDVAFATRGGNTGLDYNNCQIQPPAKFNSEASFLYVVSDAEVARVEDKFANYILANHITAWP